MIDPKNTEVQNRSLEQGFKHITEIEVYLTCDPKTLAVKEEEQLAKLFPQHKNQIVICYDDVTDQMVASLMVSGPTDEDNISQVTKILSENSVGYNKIELVD